ncbi:rhodanese-like domain-containing protein [Winogradskyella thalassocola]|uniref:Rhodanese-related sulfurtransferase n=1 Tax=Winogradskyella thalassocola TaxID=262004 RepID=A0A1G7YHY7_9FLAO|nr:rhodanese-like domain-containing protein [Winogradskyella thalassocola]SDG95845.1 Rhodanese-related sulfurtransferase [Winogradskyella thalassocola]
MRNLIILSFLLLSCFGNSQETLQELLKTHNKERIPYISVQELAMPKTDAILLDAREIKEYNVSHIPNSTYVGYDDFDLDTVVKSIPDTSKTIVIYCSVGIRSEDIAEQLKKKGYTNVYNLFGGIFEWKNNNFPLLDSEGNETDYVHAYSKDWSKWLLKGIKIYE